MGVDGILSTLWYYIQIGLYSGLFVAIGIIALLIWILYVR